MPQLVLSTYSHNSNNKKKKRFRFRVILGPQKVRKMEAIPIRSFGKPRKAKINAESSMV